MPERLGELAPPLVIVCEPCRRRGSYPLCRLLERFGRSASLADVVRTLTASCRWQHREGQRVGNQYVPKCRATVERITHVPSHATNLSGAKNLPLVIDEWLPDKQSVVEQLAIASRKTLAVETYEAAVRLNPTGLITLRHGSRRMMGTFDEPHQDYPPGKWEPPSSS